MESMVLLDTFGNQEAFFIFIVGDLVICLATFQVQVVVTIVH